MTSVTSVRISAEQLLASPELLDAAFASMPENDPARGAMRTYASDLLSMPGAQFVSWRSKEPGKLGVQFADRGHQILADAVLKDSVAGAQLLLKTDARPDVPMPKDSSEGERPVPRKQPYWESVSNMRRAVSGMKGIYDFSATNQHGYQSISFKATSQTHVDRLRPLISEKFGPFQTKFWAPKSPKA